MTISPSTLTLISLLLMFLTLILMALLMLLTVKQWRAMSRERNEVELAQANLISKSMGLLSTTDPLAYQAVQAMDPVTSPQPEENEEDPLAKMEAEEQADDLINRALEEGYDNLSEADLERFNAKRRYLNPADGFIR